MVYEEKTQKISFCREVKKIKTPYRKKIPQFTTMHVIEGQANK